MAARRSAAAPDRPYPYDRDETHAGREARIPGRTGLFLVHAFETNPRNGASWWYLFGPVGPATRDGHRKKDAGQWVHVRDIKLVPARRG